MPRVKQKTKAEDLNRIRNNQRRCRQRKRDYVTELELRLANMESTTSQEICRLRGVADELLQENERLRGLLDSTCVDRRCGERSRQIDVAEQLEGNISITSDSMDDGKVFPVTSWIGLEQGEKSIVKSPVHPELCPSPSMSLDHLTDFFRETDYPQNMPSMEPDSIFLLSNQVPPHTTAPTADVEASDYTQDTTVCAVALELVMSCNRKNLSISELDMRLRCGYRRAQFQWEGCRVDNRVLFAVMSEIT
ncbi:hypothetical protein P168DRAFT_74839 [Aspergillus campestris IBT 28561]|uniref:BZIP domain-containing protein n=1 Tax=Aspergillus campestris (strain IBT 28561) TaxID=1392248 RepID=A0A2I1CRJ1_ASPC2|nr:uncharacterized protein P168DRAFT_74839 [Aspergillus campestris IBT 28561]PKY00243.1 hypothetical protein P168DRAFT_74839 [Aspergillus campestris IBT 28561]